MLYAIDRQHIIDVVYKGGAAIQNGPVPPTVYHSLENPDFAKNFPELAAKYQLRLYTYDPAVANQLLDQAGWTASCGDPAKCVREKDGRKLSFMYYTTRNAMRQAIQALVGSDLKSIGVDAQVLNYPTGCYSDCDYTKYLYTAPLTEAGYVTNASSNFDAWDLYEPSTEQNYDGPNIQQYSNLKVDAANRLFKTSIDRATLAEQSAIIQTELMNDAAIIPIAQRANIEIYSGKMRGRKPTNNTVPNWWNIGQWYFVP
jgi:peptide/nickel transport system substrate-binding protein